MPGAEGPAITLASRVRVRALALVFPSALFLGDTESTTGGRHVGQTSLASAPTVTLSQNDRVASSTRSAGSGRAASASDTPALGTRLLKGRRIRLPPRAGRPWVGKRCEYTVRSFYAQVNYESDSPPYTSPTMLHSMTRNSKTTRTRQRTHS